MAVDGEVVEEANGGGRWCAHTSSVEIECT